MEPRVGSPSLSGRGNIVSYLRKISIPARYVSRLGYLNRVVLEMLDDHTELFKQFSDNADF